jgi:hypothetical protein
MSSDFNSLHLEVLCLWANGRVDVHIALIMAVVTADYWGNLHRPTIGLRSAAEHTDRWAAATRPFAPRSGAIVKLSGKYHDESFPAKYHLRIPVNRQGKDCAQWYLSAQTFG